MYYFFSRSGIHQIERSDWLVRGPESYDTDLDSGPLTAKCWQKKQQQQSFKKFYFAYIIH